MRLAVGFNFGIYQFKSGHLRQFSDGFVDFFFRFGQFITTYFHQNGSSFHFFGQLINADAVVLQLINDLLEFFKLYNARLWEELVDA